MVQRFPESKLLDFGLTLVEETWNAINDTQSPTEMVDSFKKYSKEMVDIFFLPVNVVQSGPTDKPFFTEELRHMKRRRQRAYNSHGRRSEEYRYLVNFFDSKLRIERQKYIEKVQKEVSLGKRGSAYQAIRKLGNWPGESWARPDIMLPSHCEENLSPTQSANRLEDHFSSISQSIQPLDEDQFHPALKLALERGKMESKPTLGLHENKESE